MVDIERKGTAPVAVNIPHGKLVFDLVYDKDKYSAMLQGQGIFDQANGRGENLYANNTYWVWNASMNYKINKNARLYLKSIIFLTNSIPVLIKAAKFLILTNGMLNLDVTIRWDSIIPSNIRDNSKAIRMFKCEWLFCMVFISRSCPVFRSKAY